jgi:hypothetical protein
LDDEVEKERERRGEEKNRVKSPEKIMIMLIIL